MKLSWGIAICNFYLFVGVYSGIYVNVDKYRYFISYPDEKNWYSALRYCTFQGDTLVNIDSPEENNRVIKAILSSNLSIENELKHVWMGGTDLGDTGHFYWATTGQSVLYSFYHRGEPSGGNEHCLEFRPFLHFLWNDVNCNKPRFFICRSEI